MQVSARVPVLRPVYGVSVAKVASDTIDTRRPFDPETRSLTVGILLGVTLFAFDSLAVVTIAPLFAEELGGLNLYGWVFSGFLLTSLLGSVGGGQLADQGSLVRPLLIGLVVFGAGLAVSASAPNMLLLIGGRVLQGLGGGALGTVLFTAITRAYPDRARAKMMAFTSSAWIVPALLGPTLAGLVAEAFHWRYVFWGILPLLAVVGALTIRPFRELGLSQGSTPARGRLPAALTLAAGAGLFLIGIGSQTPWLALLLALLGAAMAGLGLRTLMPPGTLRLARGLPSAVAGRGTIFAAFVGVEAFLALMLTSVHGYSTTVTGAVIAAGSISWAAGAWLQSKLDENHADERPQRMFVGAGLIALGIAAQIAALFVVGFPLLITVAGWVVAGLGIGIAHSTSSVLAIELIPAGEEGRVSAALQISDQFMAAVSTGVGGALLALATRMAWGQRFGILLALCFVIVLAFVALAASWRSAPQRSA